jgi:endo-1,4-beta-xylanase
MQFLSLVVAAVTLSGFATASPYVITPQTSNFRDFYWPAILSYLETRQTQGLNAAFKAKGREYVGTSLTIRSDTAEQNIIKNSSEFGSITPENAQKWDQTESSRGSFNFGGGDQHVNWATQNGKHLRCHTLVWHSQLPGWVSNGGFNNATLIQIMTNHINSVMGRWKGKCNHWDVVNEGTLGWFSNRTVLSRDILALNEDGTYRSSVFYRVIGEAFIPIAFRIAAAADPSAKLYYNDYNLEYGADSPKTKGAVRILKLVQSWGIKIDGVGFQGHMVSERTGTQETPTPSVAVLEGSLRAFTDLGVDVAYTEIDVRHNSPVNAAKSEVAAAAWGRMTTSCMNVPRCIGYTVWVSQSSSDTVYTRYWPSSGRLWQILMGSRNV